MASLPPSPFDRDRRNRRTLMAMAGVGLAMLGLGFASVPLYRIFCEQTGFGGTTQRASSNVNVQPAVGHTMSIRFDSNIQPGMPWQFYPERRTDTVTVGARDMAIFIAKEHVRQAGHRNGELQRHADSGWRLFHQDPMLLLHGANLAAWPGSPDASALLC